MKDNIEARLAERRRARRKKMRRWRLAWTIIGIGEALVAAVPAGAIAALLVPMGYRQRGSFELGGEWLAIALAFCGAFIFVHGRVCDKVFGKRGGQRGGRQQHQRAGREVPRLPDRAGGVE